MRHQDGSGARARLLTRGGAVVTGVLVMASCGTQGATSSQRTALRPSSTWAAPPASSPVMVATKAAIAAYGGMWQDMAAAARTSDWQSSWIGRHASGDALLVISKSLYTDHLNGVVTRGAPAESPTVSSVDPPHDPTTVMINDCGDSSTWLKYRNGQLFDTPGGRRAITAEVNKQPDGSWKVTRFAVEALGSC
jgi:hypothetical protein